MDSTARVRVHQYISGWLATLPWKDPSDPSGAEVFSAEDMRSRQLEIPGTGGSVPQATDTNDFLS